MFHISANINFNNFGLVAGRDAMGDVQQLWFTRVTNPVLAGTGGQKMYCDKINCNYRAWNKPGGPSGREFYHVGAHPIWTEDYFNRFFVSDNPPSSGFDFRIRECPSFGVSITSPSNNQKISRSKGARISAQFNRKPGSSDNIKFYYVPFVNKPIIDISCNDVRGKWVEIKNVTRSSNSWSVDWKSGTGQNFPTTNGKYFLVANASFGGVQCTGNPAYDPTNGKSCASNTYRSWCNASGDRTEPVMWKVVEIVN